ncbi:gliding motility-associated C-terminal domain-containing protein [Mucilaginibacter mali]|uniref:Gliding motility-associated C-terminal domain-containing protein n=1 Tax=Mucilaginibacter mali TaxID=2740462 RepID=A0A7D4TJY5_9SPHI|nr:gliding motility-associated C-terminal domain-containing protein [Mucilaginibacter mali]QKJ28333.1 gliding motility-associated C-terminal domain-containing protein [Mucilaginibacter mali]
MSAYKRTLLTLAILFAAIIPALGQCISDATITADNGGVLCSGNNITLTVHVTGGTAPYSYSWSTGDNTAVINVNKPGTYTVIIGDSTPGCTSIIRSFTVTSAPTPAPPTAPGVVVCKGNPATLQATAPPGAIFQWYDSNGSFLAPGATYTTGPITANTFFYVDATVGGCTGPRALVQVSLSADPTTTGANICAGNTATITAAGGDSYTWYDAPTNGNQVGQGPSITVSPPATTTYYVVAVTNGCASAPIPATVTVTPYPQSPVTTFPGTPVCQGSSVNLHASVGDGGTISWYDSPTSTTPLIISPDYSTPGLTGTITYYAENALGQCTSPRVPVTITVIPIPDAPTVAPATACNGTSAVLTASSPSGNSFIWYADAAGTTPLPNNTANPFTTPILTATTTYYVQTVNGGCSSGLTPVTITVNDSPPAPTVAPVSQPCPGTAATLTAIAPGNGTYSWYDAATNGNLLFSGDTYTPIVSTNTTFYVQITDATTGCTSSRTAVPVTVLPAVTPPTVNPVTTCYNTPATLTATGSDNYQWFDAAAGGNQLTTGDTFTTDPLTSSVTYYVQTIVNGCASTRTPVTVTVTPVPQQPTVSGGATNICPGTPTTLTASVTDGGTIKWYNVATGGTVLGTGNNFTPTVNSTTTYYAENNLGTCTSTRASVQVTTTPFISPQFQYPSATVCQTAGSFAPTIGEPTGGTFSASPATLVINPTTGVINATASPVGKYTITFKSNNSCQTISQATVSIVLNPDATFTYPNPSYCNVGTPNPAPVFPGLASAGTFTASSPDLVFTDVNTGVIDLTKSKPGTYTIFNNIPQTGTCLQANASTSVTINEGVIINAGPDQNAGYGFSVQLAGTATGAQGVRWTTSGTGIFDDDKLLNAKYTPDPGETTVTLTLTSTSAATCGTLLDKMVINIAARPTAPDVMTPQPACDGSKTVLAIKNPTPGNIYNWFNVPVGGTSLFTGDTYTTGPIDNTHNTFYVQTTVLGNTSARTQVIVPINPIPAQPVAPPQSICYGTQAILKASGSPQGYEWYATAVGGAPLSPTDTYTTPNLFGNTAYYVQSVNNGCVSPRIRVDVTIIQPPKFTSSATDMVCSGSLLTYTPTTNVAATFTWDRPAVAGISNATASGTSGTISETLLNETANPIKVTYNITATTPQGCSTVLQYIVTVNPFGKVLSDNKGSVCNGVPLNYEFKFSHPGVAFRWSRAAVAGISNLPVSDQAANPIKESLFNTTNAPVDVTYVFNYTEGNCPGTFTYVATVSPAITVSSTSYMDVCSGIAFNYNITSSAQGATFKWSRVFADGISNAVVTDATSEQINEALHNTTNSIVYATYFITPIANGCEGPSFRFVVGVYPVPVAPQAYSNSPVCAGNTIFLQTPAVPNATYQWTGPNNFLKNERNPQIPNATAANAGTYHLTVIVNNCPSPPASIDVNINAPPVVTVGPDQTVCITQNIINVTGNVSGGTTTGIWTSSGSGSFSSQSQLNTQYMPSAQDKANGSVALTLTSTSRDDCTPDAKTTVITFGPTPAVDAGQDMDACSQNPIPLSGVALKNGPVTWSTSGTGTFTPSAKSLTASYMPSPADAANGSVKLTLTYDNATVCDIPSNDVVIKLIPPPVVDAGGTRFVLKDHTITLEPNIPGGDTNLKYLWTPNIGLNDNTIKNPVVTGGDKDILYTLTVTDSRGCAGYDEALVKVSPVINVPNTFTPNGDGVNDFWVITGLTAYTDANVDVYNRYGKLLYHSVSYPKAWDGTYNGQLLPVGTYYYVIRLNVNGQVLSGSVSILR